MHLKVNELGFTKISFHAPCKSLLLVIYLSQHYQSTTSLFILSQEYSRLLLETQKYRFFSLRMSQPLCSCGEGRFPSDASFSSVVFWSIWKQRV